ncbi:retrovirus-related pol polyprotein from transposon TNT 1-94 [Tanacetum coccineum]
MGQTDPLLVAYSNVHNLESHATPSYSHLPQPYYVTHPTSVIDHKEDYQGEIQVDAQEDKLKTTIILLARAITQHYSTPTNNRLRTSSNTRIQAVIQSKNVGYAGHVIRNAGRQNRNSVATAGNGMVQLMEANDQTIQRASQTESNPGKPNVQCYNCNARGHYVHDCPQPKVRDSKFFREHMLLALKDKAGGNLKEEENAFMLDNYYGDDSLEELNAAVIMMVHIQPTDDTGATSSRSNADILSEVNALTKHNNNRMPSKSVHEYKNHAKLKTVINTSDDDQIDSIIIFDDPYVEDNGG